MMAVYAGFLLSVTLYLQGDLGFTPRRGPSFRCVRERVRRRAEAPTRAGSLATRAVALAIGLIASAGGWQTAIMTPLLFAGGVGHARTYGPLANALTAMVGPAPAADTRGVVIAAALVVSVLGVAAFFGVYLDAAAEGSSALAFTAAMLAPALAPTAMVAFRALAPAEAVRAPPSDSRPTATTAIDRRPHSLSAGAIYNPP